MKGRKIKKKINSLRPKKKKKKKKELVGNSRSVKKMIK